MSQFASIDSEGTVNRIGIEGPEGTLVQLRGKYAVVHFPGHSYWTGIGRDRGYQEAEYQVWLVDDVYERSEPHLRRQSVKVAYVELLDLPVSSNPTSRAEAGEVFGQRLIKGA